MDDPAPALRLEGITKRFNGVVANEDITLEFKRGEVHTLLGENGAGKTTLMNLLYGMYKLDSGKIYRDGVRVEIKSSRDAISHGIGMIHQNFMLVSTLSVLDNIILGLGSAGFHINKKKLSADISALAAKYGIAVDLDAKVWQLSVGEQQRVELVKILYRDVDFLILDEPTAVLTPGETKKLFEVVRTITKEGGTVVFISHKLEEVMEVSDRITVLRHGRLIETIERDKTNKLELTKMMIGKSIWDNVPQMAVDHGAQEILRVVDLDCLNEKGVPALQGVTLSLRKGEVLGIAGVAGNGQRELLEVLYGLRRLEGGEVWINGENMANKTVKEISDSEVCYVPEDRALFGTIGQFDISENLILNKFWQAPFNKHGILNMDEVTSNSRRLVKEYDIRAAGITAKARTLSGGNLQKLILARELDKNPKLLLAGQPTRGLDIGATQYVRNKIVEQKTKGAAVLLVSDDLNDILALSDRIAVMYGGKIVGEMTSENINLEQLGLMMAGVAPGEIAA